MAVEAVTMEEAKFLALEYYVGVRNRLPLPMRDMPRKIVANQSLSINSMIANIESDTSIGLWLIGEYIASQEMVIVE